MQAAFSRARTVSVQAKESRIGMKPIPVPKGVTIKLNGQSLSVKVWMRLLAAAADGRGSSLRRHPDDSIVLESTRRYRQARIWGIRVRHSAGCLCVVVVCCCRVPRASSHGRLCQR